MFLQKVMEMTDQGKLDLPSAEYFSVSFLISIFGGYGTKRGERVSEIRLFVFLFVCVWTCVCKCMFVSWSLGQVWVDTD